MEPPSPANSQPQGQIAAAPAPQSGARGIKSSLELTCAPLGRSQLSYNKERSPRFALPLTFSRKGNADFATTITMISDSTPTEAPAENTGASGPLALEKREAAPGHDELGNSAPVSSAPGNDALGNSAPSSPASGVAASGVAASGVAASGGVRLGGDAPDGAAGVGAVDGDAFGGVAPGGDAFGGARDGAGEIAQTPLDDSSVEATQNRVEAIGEASDDTGGAGAARDTKARTRAVLAFGGALLIGAIAVPLALRASHTASDTPVAATQLAWEMALPSSATAVLSASAAPGVAMSGRVSPVADIAGRAPVGGAVARWVVQPGARVEAGQTVVQITSGPATRAPLPGESRQIVAEKQQTQAADDQLALAQKLSATQAKLAQAGERVARAQEKVAQSRDLIRRLRAGETVPAEAPASALPASKRSRRVAATRPNPQLAAARAKSAQSQRQLADTIDQLATARTDASGAQKSLAALQSKLDEATKTEAAISDKFDGSEASAAEVQAARVALSNARDTLKVAAARSESAQKQIPVLEKQLVARRAAADSARAALTQIAPTIPAPDAGSSGAGLPDAKDEAAPGAPDGAAPRPALSIEAAVGQANDALSESRAASREAERLHALVEQYQQQAQSSNAQIESATKVLEAAQSGPLPSVPPVRFTDARAPASGVVVWISSLAREVGAGQSVFGLSSGKKFVARFEDKSGNWKNARVGQIVSALVAPPAPETGAATAPGSSPQGAMPVEVKPTKPANTPPANAPSANTPPANAPSANMSAANAPSVGAPSANGSAANALTAGAPSANASVLSAQTAGALGARPVSVKLTRIAPPERAGDFAVLEGEIVGGASAANPGWQLLASLPDPGQAPVLTVPSAALVQRGNDTYVAVLEPAAPPPAAPPASENAAETAANAPAANAPAANAPAANAPAANAPAGNQTTTEATGTYQLQWQKVSVLQDGASSRVQSGLRAGQRVVIDPLPLLSQAPPSATALPLVKLSPM